MTAARRRTAGAQLTHRQWFVVHSWLGLKFAILLSVILLSGTIATLSHEIHWLVEPKLRVNPQAERVSWGSIAQVVSETYPNRQIVIIGPQIGPHFAVQVMTFTPEQAIRYVYVDPYTGKVTGDSHGYNIQLFLRHLQLYLFLGVRGIYIVSFFSFFLLTSLVTRLISYKKFWRGFFRAPRRRDSRTFWGDLHRLSGVWGSWFILVIAVTGSWYFVEQGLSDAGAGVRTPSALVSDDALNIAAQVLDESGRVRRISIDEAVAIAKIAIPNLKVTAITVPADVGAPIRVKGHTAAVLVRDSANAVYIDPYSGNVLYAHTAKTIGVGLRLTNTANPLHFGSFGGLFTKLIWFVFGLMLSGMAISGAYIWTRRTAKKFMEKAGAPPTMGRWKYLNVAPLIPIIILATGSIDSVGPRHWGGPAFEPKALGDCSVHLLADRSFEPDTDVTLTARFNDRCGERFRRVRASVGAPDSVIEDAPSIYGHLGLPLFSVRTAAELNASSVLILEAESWQGERLRAVWPIGHS